jgi:hypothetical protein
MMTTIATMPPLAPTIVPVPAGVLQKGRDVGLTWGFGAVGTLAVGRGRDEGAGKGVR